MPRHLISMCAGALMLFAPGCASNIGKDRRYPAVALETTRLVDAHQSKRIPSTSFNTGEAVAAVIRNQLPREHVFSVDFLRAETRQPVWKNSMLIGSGRTMFTGPDKPLRPGNYVVHVSGEGINPVMHAFTVR